MFFDGSDTRAVTPYTIANVSAGSHTVRLTLARHDDWGPRTVTVTAGRTETVDATLAPTGSGPKKLGLKLLDAEAYRSAHVIRAAPVATPSQVDISRDFPVIGDQGRQDSCVGWAVAYALKTYHERVERGWSLTNKRNVMSPAYVYNQIKLDGGGAYFVDAFNVLVEQGTSSWAAMPYDQNKDSAQPSAAARAEAAKYKIANWGAVAQTNLKLEIKRHLVAGDPVIIGIAVYPEFHNLSESNPIHDNVAGWITGYHAIVIVGYDDARSAFKIANSWGTDWGVDGYGWIDYGTFDRVIMSAYVTADVKGGPGTAPVAASNPTPGANATDVLTDTVLGWTRNARTTSFDVYIGTTPTLAAIDFQGKVEGQSFAPDLAGDATYYWRVDARGAGGITRGPVWSFKTKGIVTPPGKPVNQSPPNGAPQVSADNAVLRWQSGGSTTSYDVYVGTSAALGAGDKQATQAARSYTARTLTPGTRYYWRIVARNNWGTTQGDVWSFTAAGDPGDGQATNPDPSDGATGVTITKTLSWTAGAGATRHRVYFGTDSSPDSEYRREQSGTSYDPPGNLSANTTYYWRIDGKDANGRITAGLVWSFTAGCGPPTAPSNPTPASGATGVALSPTLSWQNGDSPCGNSITYEINVKVKGSVSSSKYTATGKSLQLQNLQKNTTYSWTMWAKDENYHTRGPACADQWNDPDSCRVAGSWTFTTGSGQIGPATNPSPTHQATGVSSATSVSWTGGTGATKHRVYFGTDSSPDSGEFKREQSGTSYDPPGNLAADTTYYWRIDSKNDQGTVVTGDVWSFTVAEAVCTTPPTAPSDPSPAKNATGVSLTPTLSWSNGDSRCNNPITYEVALERDPPGWGRNMSTTNKSVQTATLQPNTTYKWLVWAKGANGHIRNVGPSCPDQIGDPSNCTGGKDWSFTTGSGTCNAAPGKATGPNPSHQATGVSLSKSLSWSGNSCATKHRVYFGTDSTPDNSEYKGEQSGTSYDPPGNLSANTTYYWRIDEKNSHGTTTGDVWRFTTTGTTTTKKPDLYLRDFYIDTTDTIAHFGDSITLRAKVSNSGTANSGSSTTLRYYRSSNSTISSSDTQVGTDGIRSLNPGQTDNESISITVPSTYERRYYYGACVDAVSGE